ncbi:MAG: zinc ABC transporter substrate-binding protein, partial [Clostridia bacterium]|nr:zinc ABC transporter substrate-binding protein [Clostridia bacterium]
DLHSYQPTADDVVKISTADMFIFVGGESDAWVDDIIAGAKNDDLIALDLIEELGDRVKEEEIKEGMQAEDGEEGEEEEEGPEYDEHIWLSLKNASVLCGVIAEKLCAIDPDGADAYGGAAADYVSKLDELDKEYEKAVGDAKIKTVLFGDRFPFRYLVDDYGLDYYAAYTGCSAESEASFETVTFLAAKVDELSLPAILQIETASGQLAETVRAATETKDQKILTLDSLQSSVKEDVEDGKSYLDTMKKNLEVLKEALG